MSKAKRIVITGGAGGIGSQLCRTFVAAGHIVTVLERTDEKIKKLREELNNTPLLRYRRTNVADAVSVAAAADAIGPIDVLINAAAVLWPVAPFLESDLDKIRQSIEISLLGTLYSCFYFLPKLTGSTSPRIINFSGGGGGDARADHMAYSLSKTAVVRLSENLAIEYPDIAVNAIAPGAHKTTMWQDEATDPEPNNWGSITDLLDFFAWLISDDSAGISGRFINVKDEWRNPKWAERVKSDPNFLTLRRIDDFRYKKV